MKPNNFHKILVANRGEIALRIIRAIRELDKLAVVIHSEFDRDLPFVTEADEAYSLGSGTLAETYLDIAGIIEIAKAAQVDAIHPGYGFLSENDAFARACLEHNIHFIGPDPEVIQLMGQKSNARKKAADLGLPVLEGYVDALDVLIRKKKDLPYPLLIKPSAGGGGKGMRVVFDPEHFEEQAGEASREALNYFGSGELYVEKYLENPRHIEVQVLADHFGNGVHLFERECSLQRRYQKIIEEAPAASISKETREQITSAALKLVKGIGYSNAGTVEFLMEENQSFYFLEMNTRIQVEHPVTEMITNRDLIKEQIRIAQGQPLSFQQDEILITGHSIEARIYAEDPEKGFRPSTGRIETFQVPESREVRIDSGFKKGNLVESWYDPMLAKIITRGKTRADARNHLIQVLKDLRITGLQTNRDFLIELLRSESFKDNTIHTKWVDLQLESLIQSNQARRRNLNKEHLLAAATLIALQNHETPAGGLVSPWHAIGHWRILPEMTLLLHSEKYSVRYELQKGRERMHLHMENRDYQTALERKNKNNYWIRINKQVLKVWGITDRSDILLDLDGHLHRLRRMDILDRRYISAGEGQSDSASGAIQAPLNGKIVQINVKEGDQVKQGDSLLVIESMKMENKIQATMDASVEKIEVQVGDQVQTNQLIITLAFT
jgi:acetyl/propionyl-CoA carboxylase alpha subunit